MKKFIIFSPSYNENSGGIVVLHKLCSILNDLGYESYLRPYFYSYELNRNNIGEFLYQLIKWSGLGLIRRFRTNPDFNTPLYKESVVDESCVVVYPEVVFGNPMRAKNVVRWLLHQPGFHEKKFFYGENELIFKFNSAVKDFNFPGSCLSSNELKVIHYPLSVYNLEGVADTRSGTAYCVRKGRGKIFIHDDSDAVLIDGMSHEEIAKVFKRVKRFVSYDTYTAYSIFAVLCGCESIVVPDDGVSVEDWYPDEQDRYGIAYGMDDIEWAASTAYRVKDRVKREEEKVVKAVEIFAKEVLDYTDSSYG